MWEYGKNCAVFATVSKSGSLLVHTANEPCDHMYRIPSPKSYAGCSSCKLLKETHLHVIGRRNLTTEMFRRMIRGGRAGPFQTFPMLMYCSAQFLVNFGLRGSIQIIDAVLVTRWEIVFPLLMASPYVSLVRISIHIFCFCPLLSIVP